MVFNSLWETTLQRQIPDAALSRVSAYDWFGSLLMQPLGFALVGPAGRALRSDALALDRLRGAVALLPLDVRAGKCSPADGG